MNKFVLATTALTMGALAVAVTAVNAADTPPPWAYGFTTPPPATPPAPPANAPAPPPPDNVIKLTAAGSRLTYTRAEVANRFGPGDWFPEDHPPMPEVVAKGKQSASPQVFACSLCHYPNGRGRPENANLTGLSYEYIIQQLVDFRNGARKTSDPRKGNTGLMAGFTKSLTDDEMQEAARYFSTIAATQWVNVEEAATVPKARPAGGMYVRLEGAEAGMEPIGDRIIEVPVSTHDTEYLRNSHSGFVAYVPPGSLRKGEALVKNGTTVSGGKVTACTVCHGTDLHGVGPAPLLAGRSPSYLARQLYDMQHGNRNGTWTPLMAPVVSKMSPDDVLAASAYLASLKP